MLTMIMKSMMILNTINIYVFIMYGTSTHKYTFNAIIYDYYQFTFVTLYSVCYKLELQTLTKP